MALKNCKECGNEVSTKAASCPKCGAVLKKKTGCLGYIGATVLVLFILWLIGDFMGYINDGTKKSTPRRTSPVSSQSTYHPTGKEIDILRAMVKGDLIDYTDGRDSLLKTRYPAVFVTADTLQREYERNEVAADLKYKDKDLVVSGVVASIDRGIGENYYLSLMGGENMFMQPKANMADGLTDYLAGLEKGQRVNLFCKGTGFLLGSAMLTQCIPTSVWVEKTSDDFIKNINDKIEAGDKGALWMSVMATALHSVLPETSTCYSPGLSGTCLLEIGRIIKEDSKEFREAVLASAKKYGKKAGFITEDLEKKAAEEKNARADRELRTQIAKETGVTLNESGDVVGGTVEQQGRWIAKYVTRSNKPVRVTFHWSDGTSVTTEYQISDGKLVTRDIEPSSDNQKPSYPFDKNGNIRILGSETTSAYPQQGPVEGSPEPAGTPALP